MVVAGTDTSPRESLLLELRRGAIVLAVLSQLHEEEYGYSLKKLLAERGLDVDEGTLYPLLRRLEAQGLLRSRWRMEGSRPRRYYRLTAQGEKLARELSGEWKSLARAMDRLLG
jgi:PadR family transcriptional regulator PadR